MAETIKYLLGNKVTGGGAAEPTTGEIRVRFHYLDTVTGAEQIISRFYNKGNNAVFPADVGDVQATEVNPALTFQKWNHSQEKLNNLQHDFDVGATYITTDGKTYFNVRITKTTGSSEADALAHAIYLNKSDASTLNLDWGDNTAVESITLNGNFSRAHTYPRIGDYWVKIWMSTGTGTFGFGNGTALSRVWGGGTVPKRDSLRRVFLGARVTMLHTQSFTLHRSLLYINIPNSIISVGDSVFVGCQSLRSLGIPDSLTSFSADGMFSDCSSLSFISIPDSIISLGNSAFSNCYSLLSVILPNSIMDTGSNAFYYNYNLRSILIPNSVTDIGSSAFYYNRALTSIILPNSIISIGNNAFSNCSNLIECIFESVNPPTLGGTGVFASINAITKMFVPDESLDAYKTVTNWTAHSTRIFPISERRVDRW